MKHLTMLDVQKAKNTRWQYETKVLISKLACYTFSYTVVIFNTSFQACRDSYCHWNITPTWKNNIQQGKGVVNPWECLNLIYTVYGLNAPMGVIPILGDMDSVTWRSLGPPTDRPLLGITTPAFHFSHHRGTYPSGTAIQQVVQSSTW